MDSILTSIKKLLGIDEEYTHFDADIIMHINSVLFILNQIGVGPSEGFVITGEDETWEDFMPEAKMLKVQSVKTYIYAKVRLIFDPPTSSTAMQALKDLIAELEWRLNITPLPDLIVSEEEF